MRTIIPPIKSQGIKTKLVDWIFALAPKDYNTWIEPFLGTGVVGLNSKSPKAILGDTNPHIINFYKSIQDRQITASSMREYLEREGKLLLNAGNNGYDHYRLVRDRFNKEHSSYDFIFLSRAGFNGMMRFGSKGNWNIPFCKKPNRFSKQYITKISNQVSDVIKVIQPEPDWRFINKSFEDVIGLAKEDDLIYCDPPYYGRYVDYYNGWTEKDEEHLFHLLNNTSAKFILSTWHHNDYRENEMIEKYWSNFNIITKDHFYHSGGKLENRRSIVEALVCNFQFEEIETHNHGNKKQKVSTQLNLF